MENSGLIAKEESGRKSKVESVSLTEIFEEACPTYMSYGMTYDEYWYGSPNRAIFYREAYKLKIKQKDEEFWMQGVYFYDALCRVSPVLHAFSKSGTKPLHYVDKPYTQAQEEKEKQRKIDEEQEKKNENLKAMLFFDQWARATARHFEKKENAKGGKNETKNN